MNLTRCFVVVAMAACVAGPACADEALVVKPLVERKVDTLPAGELYWRIQTYPTRDAATAAAGPYTLIAESGGQVWSFTLGPGGVQDAGATKVADVGPIARVTATHWLLRINEATGPAGAVTPVHSHPGSEAFYVLSGRHSIRQVAGTLNVDAGHAEPGRGADLAMQVSSTGDAPLRSLVMFVVDADRPFSTPAALP
jgi:hypothetical protein